MNNISKASIFSLILLVCLSACSKDYLQKTPNSSVALDIAITTEVDLKNALAGTYAVLRGTDLYGRTLPVRGDLMADNEYVSNSNSGRYLPFNNFNIISTNADVSATYATAYTAITRANEIITNASVPASVNVNQYKGEAYAIRALMHFELVRNFATAYTINPTNPLGIPIVNQFFGANTSPNYQPARDSVAKVYRQIIADLEQAYSLMNGNYVSSGYLSKYAAKALEARVFQFMGDWQSAQTACLDVINNSGFALCSPTNYATVWANAALTTDKIEFMFKVAADINNNNGTNQLSYIFSQIGYGDILSTKNLYSQYTSTDVRRGLIIPATRSGNSVLAINKFQNANNLSDKDDIPVLRFADVLLILSEAYYNLGDEANANLYLNKVAKQRDTSFAGYSNSGSQILEDILTERRKEFAFEGYRFFDLVRLNRSGYTKVQEENPYTSLTIELTNSNILFPIPQSEMDLNQNMKGKQNPGY